MIDIKDISYAIRKNGVEQIFGQYIKDYGDGPVGACAIGQAMINLDTMGDPYPIIHVLDRYGAECPVGHDVSEGWAKLRPLGDVVVHLNDRHMWSFQEIADFIDSVVDAWE